MDVTARVIFKLLPAAEWAAAQAAGRFEGSAVDRRDGYIHLSGADQVVETAARHFAGQRGLVLLTVDPGALGPALRWETSRGGALFPHLYGHLPVSAVVAAAPLAAEVPVPDAVAALLRLGPGQPGHGTSAQSDRRDETRCAQR